jgi:hypothetical protein
VVAMMLSFLLKFAERLQKVKLQTCAILPLPARTLTPAAQCILSPPKRPPRAEDSATEHARPAQMTYSVAVQTAS